jgi:hypothetical protein
MERAHLEDQSMDGRILKYILKKEDGRECNGFMWLRTGNTVTTV